jgi:hypothetical protein
MLWTIILLLLAFVAGMAFMRHFREAEDAQVFADAVLTIVQMPLQLFRRTDPNERWGITDKEPPWREDENPGIRHTTCEVLDPQKVDAEIAKRKSRKKETETPAETPTAAEK